ncbi:MAG TPA: smalltalk protein [Prevotella sp.]
MSNTMNNNDWKVIIKIIITVATAILGILGGQKSLE